MAQEKKQTAMEAVNSIYKQRVDALQAADDKDREEAVEPDNVEHVDTPLPEEQRFVSNPDDLRKDASSEDEFAADLEDGEDDLDKPKPAKKTAAKKG